MDQAILQSSISASYEEGSDYCLGETRCAVRVYERYSVTGSNRVSLSVTLLGKGEELMPVSYTHLDVYKRQWQYTGTSAY